MLYKCMYVHVRVHVRTYEPYINIGCLTVSLQVENIHVYGLFIMIPTCTCTCMYLEYLGGLLRGTGDALRECVGL